VGGRTPPPLPRPSGPPAIDQASTPTRKTARQEPGAARRVALPGLPLKGEPPRRSPPPGGGGLREEPPPFETPHSKSQPFSQIYGSILPTSLIHIVLLTRGYSPWRPAAVISTEGRENRPFPLIFKGQPKYTQIPAARGLELLQERGLDLQVNCFASATRGFGTALVPGRTRGLEGGQAPPEISPSVSPHSFKKKRELFLGLLLTFQSSFYVAVIEF